MYDETRRVASPDLSPPTKRHRTWDMSSLGEVDAGLVKEILELERQDKKQFVERHVLFRRLLEMEEKYANLVWLGDQKTETHHHHRDDFASVARRILYAETSRKYPQEFQKLSSGATEWERGFNAGVLAATRLLIVYATEDATGESIEQAEKEFPNVEP